VEHRRQAGRRCEGNRAALRAGTLPAVSFVKLLGADNEHPGYADLLRGQQAVADLDAAVQASPYWRDTAVIITYDENGGRWDHVAPPAGDRLLQRRPRVPTDSLLLAG
jgi:phospholipase C